VVGLPINFSAPDDNSSVGQGELPAPGGNFWEAARSWQN